jgi:hypothetical protein
MSKKLGWKNESTFIGQAYLHEMQGRPASGRDSDHL